MLLRAILLSFASAAHVSPYGIAQSGGDTCNGGLATLPTQIRTAADLGGAFTDAVSPPISTLGLGGLDTVTYQLNLPYRRWKEEFTVVRPAPGAPMPYPVLTLFHGFGETPQALLNNTPLAAEAAARGWLVVIPTGAHVFNYGIDYAQDNIEDVFEALATLGYVMDLDRIYAVGFSMGGGAAVSYAARHLDPQRVRFAAVVNHTGSTSLRDTHSAAGLASFFENPLMFGGSPNAATFRYQRSSAIDLKPGNVIDPDTDMVRNLRHVPVIHWSANNDPLQYLVDQSRAMHLQLLQVWGGDSQWNVVQGSVHNWTTLATTILDTLATYTLQPVTEDVPVPILADRSGRWHQFTLTQRRDKEFSPALISWSTVTNEVSLGDMENIARIEFEASSSVMRLDVNSPLTVQVGTRTLQSVEVVLAGYPTAPSSVSRNGIGLAAWSHDPVSGTVTLREHEGFTRPSWVVVP